MSLTHLAVVALGIVVVLWLLGAYNRLVAMRNAIHQAWAKVQEALDQRGPTVPPLVAALREPMAAEQGALDAWLAAQSQAALVASAMRSQPLAEARALAWVAAEAALAAAASRVLALLEQQADLQQLAEVAALADGWREGQARLPFVRQVFNEAASGYNAAVAVFPTHLVARAFGLGRVGLV